MHGECGLEYGVVGKEMLLSDASEDDNEQRTMTSITP